MGLSRFVGMEKASGDAATGGPQGEGGTAAVSSPPSMVFKELITHPEGRGVCLHYGRDGRYVRENLTESRCQERIDALAHSEAAVAMWTWKLEQIKKPPEEG